MSEYTVKATPAYEEPIVRIERWRESLAHGRPMESNNLWAVISPNGGQVGMYSSRDYAESVARHLNA